MSRPSFQFYPADWLADAKLKACTHTQKGIWIDLMCLLHQSDEYGIMRWPLKHIASAIGCRVAYVKRISTLHVLCGSDHELSCPLIFTPYHARQPGEPVVLIPAQQGPIWFSKRMVRDEYVRLNRGKDTRFGSPSRRDGESPSQRQGERQGERQGDGSSSSPSPSPSSKNTFLGMDTVSREPDRARRVFLETQNQNPKPERNPNWQVPSLNDQEGLTRFAKEIGVNPDRFASYPELQAHLIETVKALNKAKRNARPAKDPLQ